MNEPLNKVERYAVAGLVGALGVLSTALSVAEALHHYWLWQTKNQHLPSSKGVSGTAGGKVRPK